TERTGGLRAGGAGRTRLLDLQCRATRGGPAADRADRTPAGPSGPPEAPAGATARPRGFAAHAARESHAGRDHRAALPAAQEAQGATRAALRRLGLDGSLQPVPAAVPLRAAARVLPRGDVHVLGAPHPGHGVSEGAILS